MKYEETEREKTIKQTRNLHEAKLQNNQRTFLTPKLHWSRFCKNSLNTNRAFVSSFKNAIKKKKKGRPPYPNPYILPSYPPLQTKQTDHSNPLTQPKPKIPILIYLASDNHWKISAVLPFCTYGFWHSYPIGLVFDHALSIYKVKGEMD